MSNDFFKISKGVNLTPQASTPSGATAGDEYYDSARATMSMFMNGNWTDAQSRSDVASASSLTSTQFTSTVMRSSLVKLTGSTSGSIHGMASASDAKYNVLYNATTVAQILKHQSTTESTAANRIITSTGADVNLGTGESALLTYDSAQSRWILLSVSGANDSAGFKNIISTLNSKFEGGTADWVTYDDGAVSSPVDGTAGSPSAITITTTTTAGELLEGTRSLKISKSAANGQGEGASVLSKSIDRGDRGTPLFISFLYDATHANFVRGDLKVFAYDVTNSTLMSVYNDSNNGELLQQKGKFNGVIFPQDTTAQIRIIIHCTTTSTLAYDVFADELLVTPQSTVVGPVMTDWINYTPDLSSHFGTTTQQVFQYRRVGDSLEVRGSFVAGTVTGTGPEVPLPAGLTINSAALGGPQRAVLGIVYLNINATTTDLSVNQGAYVITSKVGTNTSVLIAAASDLGQDETNAIFFQELTTNITSTNEAVTLEFKVPILGWSSGASLTANDAGLQTIKAVANKSAGSVTANTTIATWTNETVDNYQGFDPSTGTFTAPRAGQYYVNFNVATTTGTPIPSIRVNGSIIATGPATSGSRGFVNAMLTLAKGDLVTVTIDTSLTLTTSTVDTRLNIASIPDFNVFGVQGPVIVGVQTDWESYTPTFAGVGTATGISFIWRRNGANIDVIGKYTWGTTSATPPTITLPSGYTTDSSMPAANTAVGKALASNVNAGHYGVVTGPSSTTVQITLSNAAIAGTTNTNANGFGGAGGSGTTFTVFFSVPIEGFASETRLYPTQRVIGTTYLKDVKSSGTDGGTFTSGSYQTRTLNTQEGDTGFCSLSSNQFTLQPGTYEIEASCPANAVLNHKAKIRNTSDSTDVSIGTSQFSTNAHTSSERSFIAARITITASKTFEIQHRGNTTRATDGFGAAVTFGDSEVYTIVKIDKIY